MRSGAGLYQTFFDRVLYPAWEKGIRKRPTLDILKSLEKTQWASSDEIASLQLKELRLLLDHAYKNVPLYRRRFDEAGLHPDDVRSIEDLTRLPVLRRPEAQRTKEERTSTAPPFVAVKKSTSGTNGEPLSFGYDLRSEHWRQAVKQRGYGWAGHKLGMRTLHFWGPGPPVSRVAKAKIDIDRALKRETYLDCTKRSDPDLAQVVDVIRELRPKVIVSYTTAVVDLARYVVRSEKRDWDGINVVCGAEKLWPHDREVLVEAFGPGVFDTYGSRETMLMAAECEAHDGMHTSAENILVEVVVTENGRQRAAKPGEAGEIVVTDLHNYAMPFIRYANGDLGVAGKPGKCSCGRSLPRIDSIEGRVAETVRDGRGGKVGGMIFINTFVPLAHAVRQFQAVQHADESITLKLVTTSAFDDAARAHIDRMMRQHLGGVNVRVELVKDIPLSASGKRRMVVVE